MNKIINNKDYNKIKEILNEFDLRNIYLFFNLDLSEELTLDNLIYKLNIQNNLILKLILKFINWNTLDKIYFLKLLNDKKINKLLEEFKEDNNLEKYLLEKYFNNLNEKKIFLKQEEKNIIELDFTDEVIINDQENSNSFMVNDLEISKLKKEFSD